MTLLRAATGEIFRKGTGELARSPGCDADCCGASSCTCDDTLSSVTADLSSVTLDNPFAPASCSWGSIALAKSGSCPTVTWTGSSSCGDGCSTWGATLRFAPAAAPLDCYVLEVEFNQIACGGILEVVTYIRTGTSPLGTYTKYDPLTLYPSQPGTITVT